MGVCGQVDDNAAAHSCSASVSSLILLLLDGLREVLITEAPEGLECSKLSKLNLEREDGTIERLKESLGRVAASAQISALPACTLDPLRFLLRRMTLMATAGTEDGFKVVKMIHTHYLKIELYRAQL